MQTHHRYHLFLAVVGVLATSWRLLGPNTNAAKSLGASSFDLDFNEDGVAFDSSAAWRHRSLGVVAAPSTDPIESGNTTTITVYLTDHWPNPALSIFRTGLLDKYSTGRISWRFEEGECSASCDASVSGEAEAGPCLAVGRGGKWGCPLDQLKCNYPACKTMVTNDERCEEPDFDVREYYSANFPNRAYLPLGPRMDAWASLEKIRGTPDFVPKKSSERKYAFNAIFSQSTDKGRRLLARQLKTTRSALSTFASMAKGWAQDPNDPSNALLDTNSYAEVLLDSVFTLSPAGHNSECFRLFEAVEAGSIPILVWNNLHQRWPCAQSLVHWHDAPIIVLGSWRELHGTVERLMEDPAALDAKQQELAEWYDAYWRERIREFEDFMLDADIEEESAEENDVAEIAESAKSVAESAQMQRALGEETPSSRRQLRFSPLMVDPKTVTQRVTNTVTIYLARQRREDKFNQALSVFKTDVLRRYGSGRVQFLIREHAECPLDCKASDNAITAPLDHSPCLVVSRHAPAMYCDLERMKCNYPHCKTMAANDEMCHSINEGFDAREYYTSDRPELGYLPLGPRYDSWQSFQKLREHPNFIIPPASKRRHAFNAIFSQSTNLERQRLAEDIETRGRTAKLPIYTAMAKQWSGQANDARSAQLSTDEYVAVVLDSIFTLSPAGHSPECFRLFEAVEAGSIPVMSYDDLHGAHHPNERGRKNLMKAPHPCKDSLFHWYDAPIVVLESWGDLYPTLEGLMADPAALDERQAKLREWYDDYMRGAVARFETFMLDSSPPLAVTS